MTHRARLARTALLAAALPLAGCGAADRLASVGRAPGLTPVVAARPELASYPVPPATQGLARSRASLWRAGSRAFFKDQRAAAVGDILTVRVRVADRANIDNSTQRSRKAGEGLGAQNIFGFEGRLSRILPEEVKADSLLKATSDSTSQGQGSVKRSEQLVTSVAAVVTAVLPNGNLVIQGRQEVRVNFELRELAVAGVVRPEDIESDNVIDSAKIAEARIAYGGRGQITDVQQPRYGQQALDVLLPF